MHADLKINESLILKPLDIKTELVEEEHFSKETHELWQMVKDEMEKVDPILAKFMVPACIHQGHCPELESCGFAKTEKFTNSLYEYHNLTK